MVMLSGCISLGPNFTTPRLGNGVTAYSAEGERTPTGTRLADVESGQAWWRSFGSADLDRTVQIGLSQSPSLAETRATLERFQAAERLARGSLEPQAQITADAQRQRFNSQAFGFKGFPNHTFDVYSLGAAVSYDLDLFGGGRRRNEQARARRERAAHQLDAGTLTLSGNIVLEAMQIAGLTAQLGAAGQIVADDRRMLDMVRAANALGGESRASETGSGAQVIEDEAMIAPLQRQLEIARHQLALLVGRAPATWTQPDFALERFTAPTDIPVAMPSSLLRRRPDILAAEAELHAATAAVGVAQAAQYPDIRLSGGLTQGTGNVSDLFSYDATGWNLVSGLTAPIFDGGGRRAEVKAAKSEVRAAQARYQQTVLRAFVQVSDLLSALQYDQRQLAVLGRAMEAGEREMADAEAAWRLGSTPLVRVVEAHRRLARLRFNLADAQARRLSDTAQLYAAVASDWHDPAGEPHGVAAGH